MPKRIFICSDLDRTLLPNGTEPESPDARKRFARLVGREEVTLAYVSGRHKALVAEAIEHYALPLPNYIIGDVGTTLYAINGKASPSDWQSSLEWEAEIAADWAGQSHQALKQMMDDLPDLHLQEAVKQNRYKLSYYVSRKIEWKALDGIIRQRFMEGGIKASRIWSVDAASNRGLLDLVPENATKYHAIDFLMRQLKIPIENTFFAGDSGNDLEVLLSPIQAVLVANATPEVRDSARKRAESEGHLPSLYFAKGGFLEMNGNYCAGLLEGLAHFMPETVDWMQKE